MLYNEETSRIKIETLEENGNKSDCAVCYTDYDLTCFCDYISDKLMEKSPFPFVMRFSPEKIPLPSEYPILAKYDYTNAIFDWNSVCNKT